MFSLIKFVCLYYYQVMEELIQKCAVPHQNTPDTPLVSMVSPKAPTYSTFSLVDDDLEPGELKRRMAADLSEGKENRAYYPNVDTTDY